MQTVGRSPDISVMWRTEYYAGAGYIRHVAVKRLNKIFQYFNWRCRLMQVVLYNGRKMVVVVVVVV